MTTSRTTKGQEGSCGRRQQRQQQMQDGGPRPKSVGPKSVRRKKPRQTRKKPYHCARFGSAGFTVIYIWMQYWHTYSTADEIAVKYYQYPSCVLQEHIYIVMKIVNHAKRVVQACLVEYILM
eukprot:6201266-Pleurochrysis_carterae.AAC.6